MFLCVCVGCVFFGGGSLAYVCLIALIVFSIVVVFARCLLLFMFVY